MGQFIRSFKSSDLAYMFEHTSGNSLKVTKPQQWLHGSSIGAKTGYTLQIPNNISACIYTRYKHQIFSGIN